MTGGEVYDFVIKRWGYWDWKVEEIVLGREKSHSKAIESFEESLMQEIELNVQAGSERCDNGIRKPQRCSKTVHSPAWPDPDWPNEW